MTTIRETLERLVCRFAGHNFGRELSLGATIAAQRRDCIRCGYFYQRYYVDQPGCMLRGGIRTGHTHRRNRR